MGVPPLCTREERFFPDTERELERCQEEVQKFLVATKRLIDRHAIDLEFDIQREYGDALRVFNCLADGGDSCY